MTATKRTQILVWSGLLGVWRIYTLSNLVLKRGEFVATITVVSNIVRNIPRRNEDVTSERGSKPTAAGVLLRRIVMSLPV